MRMVVAVALGAAWGAMCEQAGFNVTGSVLEFLVVVVPCLALGWLSSWRNI